MEALAMAAGERGELHQFGRPRGWIGGLVGHLMALKNGAMNRAALAELALAPGERVLEIGCGPGTALNNAARRMEGGFAVGIDHSAVMAGQAARRNRRLIRAGRVEVICGGVSEIPYPDGSFDKAFAINSFQFWPYPVADLTELRRVLKPGGRLVLTIRATERPLRLDLADAGGGGARVKRARRAMAAAGFAEVSVTARKTGRVLAVCVVGHKPMAGDGRARRGESPGRRQPSTTDLRP